MKYKCFLCTREVGDYLDLDMHLMESHGLGRDTKETVCCSCCGMELGPQDVKQWDKKINAVFTEHYENCLAYLASLLAGRLVQ